MKKLLLPMLILLSVPLSAFYFPSGSAVRVLKTRYFDIIYSEETASSARLLAESADGEYERICGLLSATEDIRIPVILSPLEADTGGFNTLYPYTKIVLYDVPPEPESSVGNNEHYLMDMFVHELTHAISLNIRSPFWDFFRPLGGDYYTAPNNIWMMPMYMIEGVTVSFESLRGYGRLNDPFIRQILLQASLDGKFLTPSAASGALDRFPFGGAYYYYGGFFSRYLQEVYGMERYADLWHRTGEGLIIPGFEGAFRQVYDTSLQEEWKIFQGLYRTGCSLLQPGRALLDRADYIVDMTGRNGILYYISAYDSSVHRLDTDTGKSIQLFTLDYVDEAALDVSPGGDRLLVSMLEDTEDGTVRVTRIYDTRKNVFVDAPIPDLREACITSDGSIVGVLVNGGRTSLARCSERKTEILLSADETEVIGRVRELSEGVFVFLALVDGSRDIYLFDEHDGSVHRINLPLVSAAYPRDLAVADGRILFVYNDDYSFYRLAIIDENRFFCQETRVSGGVFDPAVCGERLFHTSLFSDGWMISEYPVRLNDSLKEAGVVEFFPSDAFQVSDGPSGFSLSPDIETGAAYRPIEYLSPRIILPYIGEGTITVDDEGEVEVEGFGSVGLETYSVDPAEETEISLHGGYAWRNPFIEAGFEWTSYRLPADITLSIQDDLSGTEGSDTAYRDSSATVELSAGNTDPLTGGSYSLYGAARADYYAPRSTAGSSPYAWDYASRSYTTYVSVSAGMDLPNRIDMAARCTGSFSAYGDFGSAMTLSRYLSAAVSMERDFTDYRILSVQAGGLCDVDPSPVVEVNTAVEFGNFRSVFPGFLDYRGCSLKGFLDYNVMIETWKSAVQLTMAPPVIPVYIRLYGAYCPEPVFSTAGVESFRSSGHYPLYPELEDADSVSGYYAGGDLELRIFNVEPQHRFWIFPLFINRFNLSAGYRGAFSGGPYSHSVFGRVGCTLSPLVGAYSKFHVSLRLECAYSISGGNFVFSLF